MKRIAIIAIAAALFASTTAIAFADDPEVEAETGETRELNESQLLKARLLADYFADYIVGDGAIGDTTDEGAAVDEISALRSGDTVVGWGAMFKLLQLAKANEMTLDELLMDIGPDEGWAFGRRFKELGEDDPRKIADDTPKNLGQLKKQEREPKGNQGKKP
jgi:hypothetical protein